MPKKTLAPRLRRLPRAAALGGEFPLANGMRARLLGLAWLGRERAGAGLLIPRCAGVHTFGMRFDLDVYFLDYRGRPIEVRRDVGPRRFLRCRAASAVLETPSEAPEA
jgi:hypothetical protein